MVNMKKTGQILLCVLLLVMMAASCLAEEYYGENTHGAGGVIRVTVTMEGDRIVKIKTTEQHETKGLGTTAIKKLTAEIVEKNSVDVDDVSGATLSSVAFKAAVRQAVESALGANTDYEIAENEYIGVSENALGGRLAVKLTVIDGVITAVDVPESHESADIGDPAIEIMKNRILEANSADVDGVTGATFTCNAMREAAKAAMESAAK